MLRASRVVGVCCALTLMACPEEPSAPDAGDDTFTHQKMAVHCWNSIPLQNFTRSASAPDELVGSYWGSFGDQQTEAQGLMVSHDRGRTFERVVVRVATPQGETLTASYAGPNAYFESADFWASEAQTALGSGEVDEIGALKQMTISLHGVARFVQLNRVTQTIGGVAITHLWKASAQDWFARSANDWIYASRDGGQTLKRLGPARVTRFGNAILYARHGHKDSIFYEDASENGQWYRRDGSGAIRHLTENTDYPKHPTPHQLSSSNGIFGSWGDRLVYTDRFRVWVSDDEGASWTKLSTAEVTGPGALNVIDDPTTGALWAYPDFGGIGAAPRRFFSYRWERGQTTPTVIDFDWGDLPADSIVTPSFASDGQLLFLTYRGAHRDFRTYALCEAGPATTQTLLEPVVVEPWEAAASDRVVLVARFTDGSTSAMRMAVSPARKLYAETPGKVFAHPFDAPPLYTAPGFDQFNNGHPDAGIFPRALFDATETSVSAVLFAETELIVQPLTLKVSFDARDGTQLSRVAVGKSEEIYEVFSTGGFSFDHAKTGLYYADYRAPRADDPFALEFPTFSTSMVLNGKYGALVSDLNGRFSPDQKSPAFVMRFDPTQGRVPDSSGCSPADGGMPANCLPAPEMGPTSAQLDPAGNLFVLDGRAGRVLYLPAGGSTISDWKVLAKGFATPTDLQLRALGDQTLVLVYDGDVFAFTADPTRTKVRGEGAPTRGRTRADYRAREGHGCLEDGPCLTVPDQAPFVAAAEVCVNGVRLGSSGHVFLGAKESTVTRWTDSSVCFTGPTDLSDDQLQLVREDGVGSNPMSFTAPAMITNIDVPNPLLVDSLIRVTGKNLAGATATDAVFATRTDNLLELRLGTPGTHLMTISKGTPLMGRTLVALPHVLTSCQTAAGQSCSITGVGLGVQDFGSTVTVDGMPVEILAWSNFEVRFRWPRNASVGTHAVHMVAQGGFSFDVMAEVTPLEIRTLVKGAPQPASLSWGMPRPVQTSIGLLASVADWDRLNGTPKTFYEYTADVDYGKRATDGGIAPDAVSGLTGFVKKDQPTTVAEFNGELFSAGLAADRGDEIVLSRMQPPSSSDPLSTWGARQIARVRVTPPLAVSAFEVVQGHLLLAVSQNTPSTQLFDVVPQADGGADTTLLGSVASQNGVTFTNDSMYLTSCHAGSDAQLQVAPLEADGGTLMLGPLQNLVTVPGARLTACNAADDGLIYVLHTASGEQVLRHDRANSFQILSVLDATVPGFLQTATHESELVNGIGDIAQLPGGDVLLLTNELEHPPLGLRLVRIHQGQKTLGVLVPPTTQAEPGEICVGPLTNAVDCPKRGAFGCAPLTCPLELPEQRARPGNRIGNAVMVVDGSRVRVVYEVTDTRKLPSAIFGGTDVSTVDLPIP